MRSFLTCTLFSLLLITGILTLNSCKKKVKGCTDPTATNYNSKAAVDNGLCSHLAIGQSYQGGIIAYIYKTGDAGYDIDIVHGLIAYTKEVSSNMQWYNGIDKVTGATATAIGTGNANTNTIVSVQGSGSYAAQLCSDFVLNGYNDWYLPSQMDLKMLYINRAIIGGFTNNGYWSSSEINSGAAWFLDFLNGSVSSNTKAVTECVRPVRSF